MTHRDLPLSDVRSRGADGRDDTSDLIRPCLRRAFPLLADSHENDERFRLLLDALAQRSAKKE